MRELLLTETYESYTRPKTPQIRQAIFEREVVASVSTTIAIGIATDNAPEVYRRIEDAAGKFGYGAAQGIAFAEAESRAGLSEIAGAFDIAVVALLRVPVDHPAALASAIQDELLKWELELERPKFFDFLSQLSKSLRGLASRMLVAFAGEWKEGDRIRLHQGPIEDLIELLKRPGNWYQRLYVPSTGRWQDSDEVPLVFVTDL